MEKSLTVRPISFWKTFLWFAIPGSFLYCSLNLLMPWLIKQGVPHFFAYTMTLYLPLGILIPTALAGMRLEGNDLDKKTIITRFRLSKLSKKEWFIVIGAFILVTLMEQLLSPLNDLVARIFPPGSHFPDFMRPGFEIQFPVEQFVGLKLSGQYWILPYMIVCLFFNVVGEGFLWRGLLLPRMELSFGKWAWLVNGLCWCIVFHIAFPHLFPAMLPGCLIAPYLAQKFKSTLASMSIHFLGNALVFVLIISGL